MTEEFKKARNKQLEICEVMYLNGELGSDYYDGSKKMSEWTYEWCNKIIINNNDYHQKDLGLLQVEMRSQHEDILYYKNELENCVERASYKNEITKENLEQAATIKKLTKELHLLRHAVRAKLGPILKRQERLHQHFIDELNNAIGKDDETD